MRLRWPFAQDGFTTPATDATPPAEPSTRAERLRAFAFAAERLRRRALCDDCSWAELRRLAEQFDATYAALTAEDLSS